MSVIEDLKNRMGKLDKHCFRHYCCFFSVSFFSLVCLCSEDNSLSGIQMLIKRKLRWMGARKQERYTQRSSRGTFRREGGKK